MLFFISWISLKRMIGSFCIFLIINISMKSQKGISPPLQTRVICLTCMVYKSKITETSPEPRDVQESSMDMQPEMNGSDSSMAGLVIDQRIIPDSNLPTQYVEGILDIANEGSGLLRPNFAPSDRDVYISASQIRRVNLR